MAIEAGAGEAVAATPQCLTANLGWLLSQANHAFATEQAAALAPLGLGSRAYCVLATAMQGDFTQKALAGVIGLDKTTMVVTIDELERLGLAKRTLSSADRRARVISVRKAGERKIAQAERIIEAVQADALNALPARAREEFVRSLTKLVSDRLSAGVECDPPLRRREPRA